MTGIVLAGGASQRMGGASKAFLQVGGIPLIERVLSTLRPLVTGLIIVVKDTRPFQRLPARIVEDIPPDAHALGGLYTGLQAASTKWSFVCACDAPFLQAGLIRALAEAATDGVDLVIPRTRDGLQPLHALYAKLALPAIEAQLRCRQHDLKALVPKVRAKLIEPDAIHRVDPQELSFFNVNTPEDLAQAIQMHRQGSSPEGTHAHGACALASSV